MDRDYESTPPKAPRPSYATLPQQPPIPTTLSFPKPQQPASADPGSPYFIKPLPCRRRTMSLPAPGLRSARESTPVPEDTPEHHGVPDRMDIDDNPSSLPCEPSPTPTHENQLRAQSLGRAPKLVTRPATPSIVQSYEVESRFTAYAQVPPNEAIEVEDGSGQWLTKEWYTGRRRPSVVGSMRGKYLEEYNEDLKLQIIDVIEAELDKPRHLRKPRNLLEDHDTSKQWDKKWAEEHRARASSTPWLNELWGPPIKNALCLTPKSPPGVGHPSATLHLSPQYGGSARAAKRASLDSVLSESPGKKPKLKLNAGPRKKHKKFTAPFMERSSTSPQLRLLPPEPSPPYRATICSNCHASEETKSLFLCARCGKNAYCSPECREKFAGWHAQTCKSTEHQDAASHMNHLSVFNDPRNYLAGEIDPWILKARDISDFRIIDWRFLEYCIAPYPENVWRRADVLIGNQWTAAMERYWESSQRTRLWRKLSKRPPFYTIDPGTIGRFITSSVLEKERTFSFDVREFDDYMDDDWRKASQLGAE